MKTVSYDKYIFTIPLLYTQVYFFSSCRDLKFRLRIKVGNAISTNQLHRIENHANLTTCQKV